LANRTVSSANECIDLEDQVKSFKGKNISSHIDLMKLEKYVYKIKNITYPKSNNNDDKM
jgi:hypothetical protein